MSQSNPPHPPQKSQPHQEIKTKSSPLLYLLFAIFCCSLGCNAGFRESYPPRPPASSYKNYLQAQLFRANKQHDAALLEMGRALTKDRGNPHLIIEYAELLHLSEKTDQGLKLLSKLIQRYPEIPSAHLSKVHILLEKKRFKEAQQSLTKGLSEHPEHLKLNLLQAQLYQKQSNLQNARKTLETLSQTHPESILAWRSLAQTAQQQDDHVAAAKAYEKLLLLSERSEKDFLQLANSYAHLNLKKEHSSTLLDCSERHPASKRCPAKLTEWILLHLDAPFTDLDLDEALSNISQDTDALLDLVVSLQNNPDLPIPRLIEVVLSLRPDLSNLAYHLGRHHQRKGAPELALKAYMRVEEDDSQASEASTHIGELLLQLKRTDEALNHAQKMMENEAQHLGGILLLAQTHITMGNRKKALQELKKSLQETPQKLPLLLFLSRIHLQNPQEHPLAKITLQRALKIDPSLRRARLDLARILLEEGGKPTEAAQILAPLNHAGLDTAELWHLRGWLQLASNKPTDAIKTLQKGLSLSPQNPQLLARLGDAQLASNKPNKARQNFTQALKKTSNETLKEELQRKLKLLNSPNSKSPRGPQP